MQYLVQARRVRRRQHSSTAAQLVEKPYADGTGKPQAVQVVDADTIPSLRTAPRPTAVLTPAPCAPGPVRTLARELNACCARPIHILGREYREHSVHGRHLIGLKAAEDAGKDLKKSYGDGKHTGTVDGLVKWWLASEHNHHQLMSKLTTRLHLGLSDPLSGVSIKPENVKITLDIRTFVLLHTPQPSLIRTHYIHR
jgi:hypothetical protein